MYFCFVVHLLVCSLSLFYSSLTWDDLVAEFVVITVIISCCKYHPNKLAMLWWACPLAVNQKCLSTPQSVCACVCVYTRLLWSFEHLQPGSVRARRLKDILFSVTILASNDFGGKNKCSTILIQVYFPPSLLAHVINPDHPFFFKAVCFDPLPKRPDLLTV